jgi:hypothetical protein
MSTFLLLVHAACRLRSLDSAAAVAAAHGWLLLEDLPLSLTRLKMYWYGTGLLSSSTAPSLAQLTALQHLKLEYGS